MSKNSKIDRKIKKKKSRLICILIILLISVFFILYTKTSLFHISNIEVCGNDKITDEKLILASGIMIDENIFKINLKTARENIILHPYVKNVKIKRKLPNKILITIDERKEAAIINYIGSYIYIDEEGIILNILSEKKDGQIIEISGIEIDKPEIGKKIAFSNEEIQENLFEFVNESKKLGLSGSFDTAYIDGNGKITICVDNGAEVAFGTLDDVKYKLNFLISILKELKSKNQSFRTIHLDKGNNAIIIKDND